MRVPSTSVSPARFFVLTYLLSWLIWVPLSLTHFHVVALGIPEGINTVLRLLGVLMPAVAAVILSSHSGGRAARRRLFAGLKVWQVGWKWWAAAVLVQPILLAASALLINRLQNSAVFKLQLANSPSEVAVTVVVLLLATCGEEIGWRGLALPALEQRYPPFIASVILGLLWAAWHLPFWLLLDTFDQFGVLYLVMNFLLAIPLTLYITWFYNHGRFSLLLVIFFHLVFNIVNTELLPITLHLGGFAVLLLLEWTLAGLISPYLESRYSGMLRRNYLADDQTGPKLEAHPVQ